MVTKTRHKTNKRKDSILEYFGAWDISDEEAKRIKKSIDDIWRNK